MPTVHPEARYGLAMAYDLHRGVTTLFGGTGGSGVDCYGDTWEWDGADWSLKATEGPSARGWPAMAYDAARERTVLFGGYSGSYPPHDDTWEWNGAVWTQQFPVDQPAGRMDHAMAYDAARGVTALFGGAWHPHGTYGDTWEWDGIEWMMRDGSGPFARADHTMAYDAVRQKVVLFGGTELPNGEANVLDGDTWEIGAAGWAPRAGGPDPRYCHAMAFDVARGVCVMFGGVWYKVNYDSGVCSADTWLWDGSPGLAGDLNCDGVVNTADIDPFILRLSQPFGFDGYLWLYPTCDALNADCNGDGAVNFDDINGFLALLGGR